jgi:hypothetical protein
VDTGRCRVVDFLHAIGDGNISFHRGSFIGVVYLHRMDFSKRVDSEPVEEGNYGGCMSRTWDPESV